MFSAPYLTHFAGIYLFHQFLQQMRFRTFLGDRTRYAQRNNRYTSSEIILALIYPMILGLEKIEVSSLLQTNGVFQYLIGLPSFPNPSTLRRFLLRASPEIFQALHKAHNDLRKTFLAKPHGHSSYWIDFDSTAKTLYGHQEGALKGYNPGHRGKRSYHPLVATEAHHGDCLGGFLRYGNAHTAENVIPLLHEAVSILPKHDRLRVRADAGFYDGAFISELENMSIGFAIVARMTPPIKRRVGGLRYQRVNRNFSVSEFHYQPHGWSRPYRFVVLRRKLDEEKDQELTLFTLKRYAYSVIVTNLDITAYGVFQFYKDRAGLERIIRILKNDFPFGTAPTGNFAANSLYAELSLLAYNLIIWFKRLCLPADWQSLTLPRLRHKLLLMPGELVRSNNRPTLKFPRNSPNREVFSYAQEKITHLRHL